MKRRLVSICVQGVCFQEKMSHVYSFAQALENGEGVANSAT
jgi:hypothetical protein